jgi:hypothetical protein
MKPTKFLIRKLKKLGHEAVSLVEYLVAEVVVRKQAMAYRIKVPYKNVDLKSKADGNLIIEVAVYYDGEFTEEPNEQPKSIKITGPDKGRH